ncbi:DUF2127 domain-containing protein [Vogesella sp. LIG4]|uniref:DUF2127 domain-containing protein n=1 Tax=Vogesella sp. LIG4 TaxID=1192162 RepID=UPI00081FAA2C|nr:DUF2127 domain-containing protein [Vogesella sp. LIG4]SCK20711.1 Uncharacterized membrane protein, DUF2068 family [Vogesella sp. LIG4]
MQTRQAIRAVAAFEAFKGFLALAGASGLLLLLHKDLHDIAVRMVEHAHLNPAAHYPSIFITAAEHLQNGKLMLIALGAAAYSTLRFVEAYGLYREATWAELLAAASGTIYVPFEIAEIIHRVSWLSVGSLLLNLAVVALMLAALWQRRQARHNSRPHH